MVHTDNDLLPNPSAGGVVESAIQHPEVLTWLSEAQRLFAEAQERLESGRVLPALSSLAAVPPLHHLLVERCSELLNGTQVETDPCNGSGTYL